MKNSLLSQSVSTQLLFVLVVKTKNYWDKKTLEWGEVLFFVHFSLSLSLLYVTWFFFVHGWYSSAVMNTGPLKRPGRFYKPTHIRIIYNILY